MTKSQVVNHFGGVEETAAALGITGSAVRQWPHVLSKNVAGGVVGTVIRRSGVEGAMAAFPAYFNTKMRKARGEGRKARAAAK